MNCRITVVWWIIANGMFTSFLYAQPQHVLEGQIRDSSGAALAGAEVSLITAGSQILSKTTSDGGGRFAFPSVELGQYLLRAKAEGFDVGETPIEFAATSTDLIRIHLRAAAQTEEITVEAAGSRVEEESVGLGRNADRLNFDEDMLNSLPADGQNTLEIITSFLSPSTNSADGGVSVIVDGVETSASGLTGQVIRRIRVNRTPYSAEYRRPGKERVEVYTQDGSLNRFHASASFYGRDSALDARNALATDKPDFQRRQFQASINGPLSRQRASFFLSAGRLLNDDSAIVRAQTLAGPVFDNVPVPERKTTLFGRIDVKTPAHHSLGASFDLLSDVEEAGVGGLRLRSLGRVESTRAPRIRLSERGLLGHVMNEVHVAIEKEIERDGGPSIGPAEKVSGAFRGGFSQDWSEKRSTRLVWSQVLSVYHGIHSFSFGGDARLAWIDLMDRSNFSGTFEFANLDAYARRSPFVFRVRQGDPGVTLRQHEAFGFFEDDMKLRRDLALTLGVRYGAQTNVRDRNNVAPRMALAYAPGDRKTVIRAGAGVFYDRVKESVKGRELTFDGLRFRETVISNPSYPNALQTGASGLTPPSVVRLDPLLRTPYFVQASIGVDRNLWTKTLVAVEYMTLRGSHLLRERNLNAPLLATGLRPDSSLLNILQVESSARSESHTLSVTFRGAIGSKGAFAAQYTFGKYRDDSAGTFALPENNFNLRPEWGRSDYDQRHRLVVTASIDLPGGFRLGTFTKLGSNLPFDITTGRDDNGDTFTNDRPVGVTRNTGIGRAFAQVDLRLTRLIRAPRLLNRRPDRNSRNVEFSVDFFNVLNRTNPDRYVGIAGSPLFGQLESARPPRTVQFSTRYRF